MFYLILYFVVTMGLLLSFLLLILVDKKQENFITILWLYDKMFVIVVTVTMNRWGVCSVRFRLVSVKFPSGSLYKTICLFVFFEIEDVHSFSLQRMLGYYSVNSHKVVLQTIRPTLFLSFFRLVVRNWI